MQVPLITRAMEVLGAQIVQVDEGFAAAPEAAVTAARETDEADAPEALVAVDEAADEPEGE